MLKGPRDQLKSHPMSKARAISPTKYTVTVKMIIPQVNLILMGLYW